MAHVVTWRELLVGAIDEHGAAALVDLAVDALRRETDLLENDEDLLALARSEHGRERGPRHRARARRAAHRRRRAAAAGRRVRPRARSPQHADARARAGYRVVQHALWRFGVAEIRSRVDDPDAAATAMEEYTDATFATGEAFMGAALERYGVERDRWVRSADAVRRATVESLLGGGAIDMARRAGGCGTSCGASTSGSSSGPTSTTPCSSPPRRPSAARARSCPVRPGRRRRVVCARCHRRGPGDRRSARRDRRARSRARGVPPQPRRSARGAPRRPARRDRGRGAVRGRRAHRAADAATSGRRRRSRSASSPTWPGTSRRTGASPTPCSPSSRHRAARGMPPSVSACTRTRSPSACGRRRSCSAARSTNAPPSCSRRCSSAARSARPTHDFRPPSRSWMMTP